MRQSPIFTSWTISCPTADKTSELRHWLASRIDLNRILTDTIRVAPSGREEVRTVEHRLGDYFAEIQLVPLSESSFRLIFRRLPQAGRFWKDLMVNLMQEIESACPQATMTVDYKGDAEPAGIPR